MSCGGGHCPLLTHPRLVAGAWAVFAAATCAAYLDRTPSQLAPVTDVIPGDSVAWVWGVAAVLLTAGAAVPAGGRSGTAARWARSAGLVVAAGMLMAWATAYLGQSVIDGSRMWVSGKNYLMLGLVAIASGQVIGRDRPRPPEADGARR